MVSDGWKLPGGLLSGQELLGCKVENPRGEGLGRIDDLMISADGGRVAYAVVSFGGALSLRNKLFAFPWSSLRVDSAKKKVILDLDKKTLSKARGFEKGHWPDLRDWDWASSLAPVATERTAIRIAPAAVGVEPRLDAPLLSESSPQEKGAPAQKGMEHWGENWQSHGLDRS